VQARIAGKPLLELEWAEAGRAGRDYWITAKVEAGKRVFAPDMIEIPIMRGGSSSSKHHHVA
jgi:hypothetical protein